MEFIIFYSNISNYLISIKIVAIGIKYHYLHNNQYIVYIHAHVGNNFSKQYFVFVMCIEFIYFSMSRFSRFWLIPLYCYKLR